MMTTRISSVSSFLLLIAVAIVALAFQAEKSDAFTTSTIKNSAMMIPRTTSKQQKQSPLITYPSSSSTSTQLYLKVKVDPSKQKNNNNLGQSKMAAYTGSIAIAVLLPVAFLIYAAIH
jgi:Mn2+/Fe2+ NRAMP family transporter